MKKLILASIILLLSINSMAALNGEQNLSCQLPHLQPTDYRATLIGPNAQNEYELILKENYYGFIFKNTYAVSEVSEIELSSENASIKELNIVDGKHLVEIKTDKAGPVTLVCE